MNITIVPMDAGHINDIAQIERQSFSRPWSEEGIKAELTNPAAVFLAAQNEEKKVVGYIGVHTVCDEGYIANLAVLPEYRGLGIGKSLLDTAIGAAQGMGLSFLSLEVRPSNKAAIALYKSREFKIAGRRKGFYSEPKEDGYIMTLRF